MHIVLFNAKIVFDRVAAITNMFHLLVFSFLLHHHNSAASTTETTNNTVEKEKVQLTSPRFHLNFEGFDNEMSLLDMKEAGKQNFSINSVSSSVTNNLTSSSFQMVDNNSNHYFNNHSPRKLRGLNNMWINKQHNNMYNSHNSDEYDGYIIDISDDNNRKKPKKVKSHRKTWMALEEIDGLKNEDVVVFITGTGTRNFALFRER